MVGLPFEDRVEAGQILASQLRAYADRADVVVLALPRGGVPVAFEIAQALRAPLDVMIVRKLGVPGHEELALGAIALGGVRVLNRRLVEELALSPSTIEAIARRQQVELERREKLYRGERPATQVAGQVVILVDDGIATGSTMRAAVQALRQQKPARIVVAVPVAPPSVCEEMQTVVDELICLAQPAGFFAVGQWYRDFSETSDEQVRSLLERANRVPVQSLM
ncbi:MAG TPA: phosphoribosyltransferase [Terriglobia bacterium]|nr:phosphoribosyltransferase [Terriglobia bacterium]